MSVLEIIEEIFKGSFLRSDEDREKDKEIRQLPNYTDYNHNYNHSNGYHTHTVEETEHHHYTGDTCSLCGTSERENIEMYGGELVICDICKRPVCCACGVMVEQDGIGCACIECADRISQQGGFQ